jgi:aminoglycoside phosphotransferase (APT) family kinase protein
LSTTPISGAPRQATDYRGSTAIDESAVTAWTQSHVADLRPPLRFELIDGGRSNLTYRVTDSRQEVWVLRRPPLGSTLATAHDMSREYRIVSALTSTNVPVAQLVGLCTDDTVTGAPFYVMKFVDGFVIRNQEEARGLAADVRLRASHSLTDALIRIHSVDPDSIGLGTLGRKDGYVSRQLKRWYTQFQASKCTEIQLVHEVHDALTRNIPEEASATIVHGDYRLDNCILDDDGEVVAVLDWELCTLGDPLADVGLLLAYWAEPGDRFTAMADSPTQIQGFASRSELCDRYAAQSGRDLSGIDYYTALGYWKISCIMAGIYTRLSSSATGVAHTREPDIDSFRERVQFMAALAAQTLAR